MEMFRETQVTKCVLKEMHGSTRQGNVCTDKAIRGDSDCSSTEETSSRETSKHTV